MGDKSYSCDITTGVCTIPFVDIKEEIEEEIKCIACCGECNFEACPLKEVD